MIESKTREKWIKHATKDIYDNKNPSQLMSVSCVLTKAQEWESWTPTWSGYKDLAAPESQGFRQQETGSVTVSWLQGQQWSAGQGRQGEGLGPQGEGMVGEGLEDEEGSVGVG